MSQKSFLLQVRNLPTIRHQAQSSVTNEYSKDPVKLVKNTRFQSPDGLIFKAPFDVVVPGMKNGTAGTVQVSVVAEKPGSQYNIGATSKFTLPGLIDNKDMYSRVSARSTAAMSGGSSANDPGVDPAALATAETAMRGRIEAKAREYVKSLPPANVAFPELLQISYQDLPGTPEANNMIRVHLKAHVSVPTFTENDLATAIVKWANTDPQGAGLTLVPQAGFSVSPIDASSSTFGLSPIAFSLKGATQVIWKVDSAAVANALAGKDKDAFQAIVNGFPSIQEAKARIEPFWSRTFPKNATTIQISVKSPANPSQ